MLLLKGIGGGVPMLEKLVELKPFVFYEFGGTTTIQKYYSVHIFGGVTSITKPFSSHLFGGVTSKLKKFVFEATLGVV